MKVNRRIIWLGGITAFLIISLSAVFNNQVKCANAQGVNACIDPWIHGMYCGINMRGNSGVRNKTHADKLLRLIPCQGKNPEILCPPDFEFVGGNFNEDQLTGWFVCIKNLSGVPARGNY